MEHRQFWRSCTIPLATSQSSSLSFTRPWPLASHSATSQSTSCGHHWTTVMDGFCSSRRIFRTRGSCLSGSISRATVSIRRSQSPAGAHFLASLCSARSLGATTTVDASGRDFSVVIIFVAHEPFKHRNPYPDVRTSGCTYSSHTGYLEQITSVEGVNEDFGCYSSVLTEGSLLYFLSDGHVIVE